MSTPQEKAAPAAAGPEAGDKAPDFTLPCDEGGDVSLSGLKGKNVVLYFYPKDDTSGCTAESCDFRDRLGDFGKMDAVILGVSKDSLKSHAKFRDKHGLNFPLLSDENGETCAKYGVWKEKSMYGRKYMGIERSTFLIGRDGKVVKAWRKVSVPGHAEDVQKAVAELG
jgi:peroxiredoxin Q/BCP